MWIQIFYFSRQNVFSLGRIYNHQIDISVESIVTHFFNTDQTLSISKIERKIVIPKKTWS